MSQRHRPAHPSRPASRSLHCVFVVTALGCLHAAARAGDGGLPAWTFGGFGTVSAVHSTEKLADYTASPLSPGQAGYGKRWAVDVDTRLGAQLGVQLDKRWSAVVQVVSERNVEHNYKPEVEWANIKYQATPDLSLRLGRIALPLYLAADYRKASYALPWVRPPVELYSTMPISNSDGFDASYRWNLAGTKQTTQVFFGGTSIRLARDFDAKAKRMMGLTQRATAGALTLQATAASAIFQVPSGGELFDVLSMFGPTGQALADRYDIRSKRVSVFSAGFNYDPGAWFVTGEIGRTNTRSLLGDQTASYLSGGYRFGTLTPYLTVSSVHANMDVQVPGLPTAGLPPQAAALALQANAVLNDFLREVPTQHAVSAGVRWDAGSNYALKLQVERARPHDGSSGTLMNAQPGYQSGKAFNVISLSADFVF